MLQIILFYNNTATFHRLFRSTPQMSAPQFPTHTRCQRLCRRSAVPRLTYTSLLARM